MTPHRFACFPHVSAHSAALAARTRPAVADDAPHVHPEPLVARINRYGYDADVVTLHAPQRTPRGKAA